MHMWHVHVACVPQRPKACAIHSRKHAVGHRFPIRVVGHRICIRRGVHDVFCVVPASDCVAPHVHFGFAMRFSSTYFLVTAALVLSACRGDTTSAMLTEPVTRRVVTTSDVRTLTGTTTYSGGSNRISFSTTLEAAWDDIRIEHGSTVVTEDFNSGAWNATHFELGNPSMPGAVENGAYRSTGVENQGSSNIARGTLRTTADFAPSASTPLVIEATLIPLSPLVNGISFLAWRTDGIPVVPYNEPNNSVRLRLHNWGYTTIAGLTAETTADFPGDFYTGSPIRVRVTDDGTDVTATFTPISNSAVSEGFLPPVSKTTANRVRAGSTVPLKFVVTNNGATVTDRSVITTIEERAATCGAGIPTGTALPRASNELQRTLTAGPQFVLLWKAPTLLGCYQVVVTLSGGNTITALFDVRR